jgi:hypothetical protein
MTSRRRTPTGACLRGLLALTLSASVATATFTGCAALPEDAPVMEQLDEQTGITIGRLGKPIELYRETFQRDPAGRFAFLAPFETNSMGRRELFLWVAIPVTIAEGTQPDVELNGKALPLGIPVRSAEAAGLSSSPYRIPTPWSAMFYYRVDAELIAKLSEAGTLAVRVSEAAKEATVITVFAATVADTRLKEFAAAR